MSAMNYTQLPDGTWKKNPTGTEYEAQPVRIWYARDNHTYRPLPLDVEAALAAMREERDAGETYGMLCGRPDCVVPEPIHASNAAAWPTFEAAARPWLEAAVALSKPPNAEVTGRPARAGPVER
jgi:hypothetical protein